MFAIPIPENKGAIAQTCVHVSRKVH